jgi:hypothetical protein
VTIHTDLSSAQHLPFSIESWAAGAADVAVKWLSMRSMGATCAKENRVDKREELTATDWGTKRKKRWWDGERGRLRERS